MTQPKDAKRLTSGQVGPKCRVWGGSPTSIFSGPPGPEKKQVSIHLPCLPFSEPPQSARKTEAALFSHVLRFFGLFDCPYQVFHKMQVFCVHGTKHDIDSLFASVICSHV